MNSFLMNYTKRDEIQLPSQEFILEAAKQSKVSLKVAKKLIKRDVYKQVKNRILGVPNVQA